MQYVVLDEDGNVYGPFTLEEASSLCDEGIFEDRLICELQQVDLSDFSEEND